MFSRWKRDVFGPPPPPSLKRKLRLESLDGRVVPSGNPGDPPDTPPPQTGDPAVQATQQLWAYEVQADGSVVFGLVETTADDAATANIATSIYDPSTGTITNADPSYAGTGTGTAAAPNLIQPNTLYQYDPTTNTWSETPLPAGGTLVMPDGGYSLTPVLSDDGTGTGFLAYPQSMALLAANSQQPGGRPPFQMPPPPPAAQGQNPVMIFPGGTLLDPATGTSYAFLEGAYVVTNPNGSYTVYPVGRPPFTIPPPAPGAELPSTLAPGAGPNGWQTLPVPRPSRPPGPAQPGPNPNGTWGGSGTGGNPPVRPPIMGPTFIIPRGPAARLGPPTAG